MKESELQEMEKARPQLAAYIRECNRRDGCLKIMEELEERIYPQVESASSNLTTPRAPMWIRFHFLAIALEIEQLPQKITTHKTMKELFDELGRRGCE